jgi:predicted RNA-binding Zn-ribbon protein involved in translation (DUF1610 family)
LNTIINMLQCPDCGLTVVDTDSMYREDFTPIKDNSQMTCKLCGAILR